MVIRETGLSEAEFAAELKTKLGRHDPTFDIDTAIKPLKGSMLKIKVRVVYDHLCLTQKKIPHNIAIIVSVPGKIWIEAKETHNCTEDGVVARPKRDVYYKVLSRTPVRAATKEVYKLRAVPHKEKASSLKTQIRYAKLELDHVEAELEAIKPEGE